MCLDRQIVPWQQGVQANRTPIAKGQGVSLEWVRCEGLKKVQTNEIVCFFGETLLHWIRPAENGARIQ